MPEMPVPQNPTSCIKELQREAFHVLPGTVNAGKGACLMHISGIFQDILVAGWAHFENELEEEAIWTSHSEPCHVHFASDPWADIHLPQGNILRSQDPKSVSILPHIHLDMK